MKKVVLSAILAVFAISASAQINSKAIGLRLGGGNGFGTEVSYQQMLNSKNRLELDLGVHSDNNYGSFGVSGIYQWTWGIDAGFYWFAGVGGQTGFWNYDDDVNNDYDDSGMWLSVLGQIGIEYHFSEIPLMLGIDARPAIGVINSYDDFDGDLSVSVRYTF